MVGVSGLLAPLSRAQDGAKPATDQAATRIEALHDENVDVRRSAAIKLRNSDPRAQRNALPELIDLLLKEKDGQVRLAVLDTLAAMGPEAASAVPALIHTLRTDYGGQGKEELHQDYRSALALAAIGQPAVEGLRGLLKERKESVRAEVIMALGRVGPDAGTAVDDLIPLLGDKSERIRREASLALGKMGTAAIAPLIAASTSENTTTRAWAVESLGYLSPASDPIQQTVLKSSRDAVPEVRAAAVKSLRRFRLPDEVLLPVVQETLRDQDERVRLAAVSLLVERRALLSTMSSELVTLLTAEQSEVARLAAYLLGKVGPEAAPLLLRALADEKSRIAPIAEALAQIGRPISGLLTQSINASESRVRQGAALALGRLRPVAPGTAQRLTVGLSDRDSEVKAAFLTAIGDLGPRGTESAPAVRSLLKDDSPEIRIKALQILARSAPRNDHLLNDLADLIDDSDPRVQRQAIDILHSLGPLGRKSLSEVIVKLSSTDTEVRLAAAEFVGSHGRAAADAVPALNALLDDPAPRLQTIAAQTLGKLGKAAQPTFDRLTPLLSAEQAEVREAAALALGSLELDAEVLRPHLAKALRDQKAEVRRAATRSIQRLGSDGALFVPDIIMLAENKENFRSVERLLRRFERSGPDVRSLPELVKQLEHNQANVRLLAIKFLGLAGPSAQVAIPALEKLGEDSNAEVRKQAKAASEQIKNPSASPPPKEQAL